MLGLIMAIVESVLDLQITKCSGYQASRFNWMVGLGEAFLF